MKKNDSPDNKSPNPSSTSSLGSTDLIKLDGTIIKSNGVTYKSNYFQFLELGNDAPDITYTAEEARKIRSHLYYLSTGSAAAVPMICGGSAKCPFAFKCPFIQIDKQRKQQDPDAPLVTPIGRNCQVEINLLNEWTRLYMEEYNIQEGAFTEIQMIRELAEIELMLWRLNNNLSKPENAELVQEVIVGVDKQGNALTRQEINAFVEAKEKLAARKSKLIKLMVGDRQEKYKKESALKMRETQDPSSNAAFLRQKLEKLLLIEVPVNEPTVIDATNQPQIEQNSTIANSSSTDNLDPISAILQLEKKSNEE